MVWNLVIVLGNTYPRCVPEGKPMTGPPNYLPQMDCNLCVGMAAAQAHFAAPRRGNLRFLRVFDGLSDVRMPYGLANKPAHVYNFPPDPG